MKKRTVLINLVTLLFLLSIISPVLAQAPDTITVSGILYDKTTDEPAPGGIPLMLHTFDNEQMSGMTDGVTAEDGSFVFENVEAPAGRLFEMMATVGKTSYFSDVAPASADSASLELPIDYYDTTTDAGGLRISQMHMVVDFFSPSLMKIAEIYVISNDSNRTVEDAVTLAEGQTATVQFNLPPGAVNLSFDQGALGERFFQTENGFADTFGVQPGAETSQLIVRYYLPYQPGASIDHPLSYPTDHVNIVVPKMGVTLNSDTFVLDSTREMGDGRMVDIYTEDSGRSDATQFSFNLTGIPQMGQSATPTGETPSVSGHNIRQFGIAILAVGVLVLGTGIWWWKHNSAIEEPTFDIPTPENRMTEAEENDIV